MAGEWRETTIGIQRFARTARRSGDAVGIRQPVGRQLHRRHVVSAAHLIIAVGDLGEDRILHRRSTARHLESSTCRPVDMVFAARGRHRVQPGRLRGPTRIVHAEATGRLASDDALRRFDRTPCRSTGIRLLLLQIVRHSSSTCDAIAARRDVPVAQQRHILQRFDDPALPTLTNNAPSPTSSARWTTRSS